MALVTMPACDICGGIGRVYDPASDTMIFCVCWPKRIALLAREKAGIGRDYLDATFEAFEPRQEFPNQQQVLDQCRAYARDWPTVKAEGRCLSILGSRTTMGKSHLAVSICLSLIDGYWTQSVVDQDVCMFVNVTNWFNDWRKFYEKYPPLPDNSSQWQDLLDNVEYRSVRGALARREDRMTKTELLILDDVSVFEPTAKRLERLYDVVDYRVRNRLPIVVTDNKSSWTEIGKKFGDEFGARIADRFARNGDTLVIELPIEKKNGRKKIK